MKNIMINKHDPNALKQALRLDARIILMQDAVYFLSSGSSYEPNLEDKLVYALDVDVMKRGLTNRLIDNVKLVDYDDLIDLLFNGETLINL